MARLPEGSTIGNFPYRIVDQIGKGNMADVYLAVQGDIAQNSAASHVVIKIARSDGKHKDFFQDAVGKEAEHLPQLRHSGVVRILPIATNGARMNSVPFLGNADLPGRPPFVVMEYLAGGSLENLLKNDRQLDLGLALDIGGKVAKALDYIHQHGLVHQDVKPENILFRRPSHPGTETEPVLIDFGIARNIGHEGFEARTIHYAAPERLSRAAPETLPPPHPSMDVWALGVVLYQMVAGQRPFDERSDKRLTSAILETEPKNPAQLRSSLPPQLTELILRILSKRPENRPTAHEVAQQLEDIAIRQGVVLSPPTVQSTAQTLPVPKPKGAVKQGSLIVAAAVAITVVAALALILATSARWRGVMPSEVETGLVRLEKQSNDLIGWPPLSVDPPQGGTVVAVALTETPTPTATPLPPTSTPVPVWTSTSTTTNTPFATSTPVIVPPTDLPTATPVPTHSPTTTPEPPTAMPAPSDTATATSTSTRPPTRPPTSTRTPTATVTSFVTSTPIRVTVTPVPTNTQRPPTAAPTPTGASQRATPTTTSNLPPNASVTLLSPSDGASGGGRYGFSWLANFTLGPGQGFELVFWRDGQTPLSSGFGLADPTATSNVSVNLDAIDANPTHPLEPGTYRWGVLLVERNPYKRLAYLGGGWRFTFNRGAESSSAPPPTPPPPPSGTGLR